MPLVLNLGSGHDYRKGAVNIDLFDQRADIKMDVRQLKGYADNTVDVVIASQILEHFNFKDGEDALREWFRVLRPGGELVVSVPDMDAVVTLFSDFPDELKAATMYFFYGTQDGPGQVHMAGYTPFSLLKLLRKVGFEVIWSDKNIPRRPTPSVRFVGRKP